MILNPRRNFSRFPPIPNCSYRRHGALAIANEWIIHFRRTAVPPQGVAVALVAATIVVVVGVTARIAESGTAVSWTQFDGPGLKARQPATPLGANTDSQGG